MRVLVTGGCGFIGSAVVRRALAEGHHVVTFDALTYAASPETLVDVAGHPRHAFVHADVCDRDALRAVFARHRPERVLHLAAETHVDRSIDGPDAFLRTNMLGTATLLDAALEHWRGLAPAERSAFRLLHVSTDEVYGALGPEGRFTEASPYAPNSPYAASKAAADMLVRAWTRTYGLPTIITNCSNNYGPYQFPEKLIPVVVLAAAAGRPIPVYGRGENMRDWLHVSDHAEALLLALERGRIGETYLIGGDAEARNLDLVRMICAALDSLRPDSPYRPHARLIEFVADRPGHDFRYAVDSAKARVELGWRPRVGLDEGLRATVEWYLGNPGWCAGARARGGDGRRLGLEIGRRGAPAPMRALAEVGHVG